MKRDEALVKNFDFPPKKSVGNKAGKVVEDRRKRLQGKTDILITTYCHFPDFELKTIVCNFFSVYLRKIVNLMVQTNPSLAVKPDKEHVILLMPFLGDNMRTNPQQSNRSSSGRGGSSRYTHHLGHIDPGIFLPTNSGFDETFSLLHLLAFLEFLCFRYFMRRGSNRNTVGCGETEIYGFKTFRI